MKNFRHLPLFFIVTSCAFLAPIFTHAQTASVVAGLQQDVEAMREEIRRLRTEVEDLRLALDHARARSNDAASSTSVKQQLESQNLAMNQTLQTQRSEVTAEMNQRFAAMERSTNQALESMKTQVNDALARQNAVVVTPPPVRQTPNNNTPSPVAIPAGMPTSGIRYKVKSGDTVSGIARANRSKINWILAANSMSASSTLRIGQEIFVPQRDTDNAN